MLLIFGRKRASIPRVKSTLLAIAFSTLIALPALAEDWVTTDGTKYENVQVVRVEDDAITIIYKDGGALVPLFKLPPALQQKYDYDPVKAKIAAEKRAKEDTENAAAMQKEMEQAEAMKRQQQIEDANKLNGTNTLSH
jgi:hypothetical protein